MRNFALLFIATTGGCVVHNHYRGTTYVAAYEDDAESGGMVSYLGATYSVFWEGQGLRVTDVVLDSPAYDAGLRKGNWITAVDGTPMRTCEQLRALISAHRPGDELRLAVHRNDDSFVEMPVRLGGRWEPRAPSAPAIRIWEPAAPTPRPSKPDED